MSSAKDKKKIIYRGALEKELKEKENPFEIGKYPIDEKFLGKCSEFYTSYDNCLKESFGDKISCRKSLKSLRRCEELSGMYEDVLQKLNIEPKQHLYRKYSRSYVE